MLPFTYIRPYFRSLRRNLTLLIDSGTLRPQATLIISCYIRRTPKGTDYLPAPHQTDHSQPASWHKGRTRHPRENTFLCKPSNTVPKSVQGAGIMRPRDVSFITREGGAAHVMGTYLSD